MFVDSNRSLVPLVRRATALIAQEGGPESHTQTPAMEFGIPAIVGVQDTLQKLADGMEITLDGRRGLILAGRRVARLND